MSNPRDPLDESALLACHDALVRLAARLTFDPNVADDVAQQAMLQVLRAPPRGGPGLKAFLAKVVSNVLANIRTAEARRSARERIVAPREALPSTADLVAHLSVHQAVVDELLRLEEPARTIVFLRFFRDEKPRAIAERLGEPVATIETRLRRALARLRERLDQRHGGDRAAWAVAAIPTAFRSTAASAALAAGVGATVMGSKAFGWAAAAVAISLMSLGVWIALPRDDASRDATRVGELASVARTDARDPARDASQSSDEQPRSPTRTAALDATPAADRSELLLRSSDGALLRNVRVVVTQHSEIVGRGTDDESGVVAFDAITGSADVFVVAEDVLVTHLVGDFAPGRRVELALPRGASVRGRVYVDGRIATEPIPFLVMFGTPMPYPDGVTQNVRDAIDVSGPYQSELFVLSRTDGTFAIDGLPLGLSLRFIVAEPHRYRIDVPGPMRTFEVEAPADGITVSLTQSAALRGRVVDERGVGVANAEVSLRFASDHPGESGMRVVCDESGAFAIWLGHDDGRPITGIRNASLLAEHATRGHVALELAGDLDRGRELGDVRLEPARTVQLRVVNDARRPIVGARLYAGLGRAPIGAPSGTDGMIDALVADVTSTLHVAAVGFDLAELAQPPAAGARQDVVLQAATALCVVVTDALGEPLPDVTIRITADEPLWTAGDGVGVARLDGLDRAFDSALLVDASSSESHGEAIVMTADEGEVVVRRIRPDLALHIVVDDPFVGVLGERRVTLRPGVEERVTFELTRSPHLLRGRVVDRRGAAVAGALIVFGPRVADVGTRRSADVRAETDASGRFALPPTWLTQGALWIVRPGFGSTLVRDVAVPEHGEERIFVVADEHLVRVRVVDVRGVALSGLEVDAVPDAAGYETLGGFMWGEEVETGVYELRGLADETVRIRATIGGATKELVHDPAIPHATLVVPALGVLTIDYAITLDAAFVWRMWIESETEPGRGFQPSGFVIDPTAKGGSVRVDAIEPGTWRVLLLRGEDDASAEPVLECRGIEVRAGETTRAVLR
ncbi:MAG: sigma-70 family RNA polymerase sigma factor [Planctomycetes bacterium]|nr:sigma-70 family RNA polymerase sigma factor [Planctomycetota bacterium]